MTGIIDMHYIKKQRELSIKEDYHMYCIYNDHSNPDLTFSNVAKYAENIGLRKPLGRQQ
jgi:hypothetical protein